jgi:hypothetical protein
VLADPRSQMVYRPMYSKNPQLTWVHDRAYGFWITKGPSVYSEMERYIVVFASDGTEVTVMMQHALYID